MSENEIKPVAPIKHAVSMAKRRCYSHVEIPVELADKALDAIDRLTEEVERMRIIKSQDGDHVSFCHAEIDRLKAERDAAVADAERYRKIEVLAAGTPEQWQVVEDAAFASHWGCIQNFSLNIDAIDAARKGG